MSKPKGSDGRPLAGAALQAYKAKRGSKSTPAKRNRPSGSTKPAPRKSGGGGGEGSRMPGVGTVAGATASLGVGVGLPKLVDYLAQRFGPAWFQKVPVQVLVRLTVTGILGVAFWMGTSTQRGKAAFAAPAIGGGVISTLSPAVQALILWALSQRRPSGDYAEAARHSRPSGPARRRELPQRASSAAMAEMANTSGRYAV